MGHTVTPLVCSECGTGQYLTGVFGIYPCSDCEHEITEQDVVLDEGEMLVTGGVQHVSVLTPND